MEINLDHGENCFVLQPKYRLICALHKRAPIQLKHSCALFIIIVLFYFSLFCTHFSRYRDGCWPQNVVSTHFRCNGIFSRLPNKLSEFHQKCFMSNDSLRRMKLTFYLSAGHMTQKPMGSYRQNVFFRRTSSRVDLAD